MNRIKLLLAIVIFFILGTACNNYNKVFKSKDYNYKLQMADEFYNKKKYKIAQQLYEELFPMYKGTVKFEELYYKDAYCFYNMKMYRDAENLYKGFLEVFPNSTKSEEVDYMRAFCYYKQSPKVELEQVSTAKSMGMMQTFINTHPGSSRNKDATEIIDKCRKKLEDKEERAAELYYYQGQFRAAALAYGTLLNNYPETVNGEKYKLKIVKSYYKFAKISIITKQIERYGKVVSEYDDFVDRFPDSKLLKEAEEYKILSNKYIKEIQNEQTTSSN